MLKNDLATVLSIYGCRFYDGDENKTEGRFVGGKIFIIDSYGVTVNVKNSKGHLACYEKSKNVFERIFEDIKGNYLFCGFNTVGPFPSSIEELKLTAILVGSKND